jgi:peptidyl-tRNA hydrolase, PTH1 family
VWLLVGLGNPGPDYAGNRHNIGFRVIDEIASRWRCDGFKAKFGGVVAAGEVASQKVVLLKPMQYMNVSGRAVQQTASFYRIEPKEVVVIHDELDLDMGITRLKVGGGHAGHNGLRSIMQELGTQEFARIRCGIGRPPGTKGFVADYVLSNFAKAQQTEAEIMIKEAADAVEETVKKGPLLAMNKVNQREKQETT